MDEKQILKIASLAKLDLTAEEISLFSKDVGKILDFVQQLDNLDLASSQVAEREPMILRTDDPGLSLNRDLVEEMAPDWQDNQFRLPGVLKKGET